MSESKSGRKRVKLGEVAVNSTLAIKDHETDGYTRYIIGKHIPEDGGLITSWNSVGDAEFGSRIRTVVRTGDVICTTRGPKLKVAVAEFDCLSAHTNFILRPKDPATFLPKILEAVIRSDAFQDHLRKHFRGSTNLFVNWSDAAQFEFALPPLDQQRRVANALEALGTVLDALTEASTVASRVFHAARSELLNGPAFASAARSVPRGWRKTILQDVADVVDGPFGSNLKSLHYRKAGRPVLQTTFIARGRYEPDADVWVFVDEDKYLREYRSEVRGGDIAMVKIGMNCGATALLPPTFGSGLLAGNCIRVRAKTDVCRTPFLLHYLQWARQAGLIERMVNATQQRALSLGRVRQLSVLLPPLEDQMAISQELDMIAAASEMTAERQEHIRALAIQVSRALD